MHCKYCFVSAGDYDRNFSIEKDYLIEWIKKAIELKNEDNIEIHLAAYGEVLLYKELIELISELRNIPKIMTISMQTNGLLLNQKNINKTEFLFFENAYYYNHENFYPYYFELIKVNSPYVELKVTNIKYEKLTSKEQAIIKYKNQIPENISY